MLEVRNLRTTFRTEDGPVTAVNGLSFSLQAGETLGIVGESGSGKSVTALSVMRLLSRNAAVTSDGIIFNGEDLATKSEAQMRKIRGHQIAMIF
ncbi:MAG TPA: ATP-binding cassette domain-containing protein, partial [Candidatus Acidoferrum sp.]|nr:ATP-binding cassette domain-containing protein [Candidatus Acidoferrum sp.]